MLLDNVAHTWYARFASELMVLALLVKEGTVVGGGHVLSDRAISPAGRSLTQFWTCLGWLIGSSGVLRVFQVRFSQNKVDSVSRSI